MPLAEDGSTDSLIKLLHIQLAQCNNTSDLRQWGWYQFRNHDVPKTTDPVEIAAAAFICLSINDDGSWRQNNSVLEAILSFLQNRRQTSPTDAELDVLLDTLSFSEVDEADVRQWFSEVFPPLP